jgi:DNA-binding MarR family transcriptional regulator
MKPERPRRARDAVLEALLAFKALNPRVSLNEIVAFLYTCENEGLTVQDLSVVAGLTQSTASRSVRALGPAGSGWTQQPALGLVEAFLHPDDGRSHVIHLSEKGRDVRDRLDAIIRTGVTIRGETEVAGL